MAAAISNSRFRRKHYQAMSIPTPIKPRLDPFAHTYASRLHGDPAFATADPLPESRQAPDPADATALVHAADALLPLEDLAAPLGGDPAAQAVLDALALHIPATGGDGGRDEHRGHAGNALAGDDGALDERLGGGTGSEATREADGDERAGEAARHDRRVGEEDAVGDEVGEGGPRGGPQERREQVARAAQPVVVEDGSQGNGTEEMVCLLVVSI